MKLTPFLSTVLILTHSFEQMGFRRIASSTLLVALYVAEAHKQKRKINKNSIMVDLDLFYTSVQTGLNVLVQAGLAETPKGEDNKQIFINLTSKGEKFFDDIFDGKSSTEPERPSTGKGMVTAALAKNKKAPAPKKEKPAPAPAAPEVVKEKPAPAPKKKAKAPAKKKPVASAAPKVAKAPVKKGTVVKKKTAPAQKPQAEVISSEPGPVGPEGVKGEDGIPAVTETKPSGLSPAAQAILDKKKAKAPAPASTGKKKLNFGK